MCDIPDCISPRDLFWLWYNRATLRQKKSARQLFKRFVTAAETERVLQVMLQLESLSDNSPHL
ncbi:MAG: hypothetical protein HC840_04575 [Leptolyngbyaceae cyanobacterium RM2_2_4]|jgi:hypothetical protein|nr:hypothetical protein [Leptolyngbyaceae cyanobacterium SM1_4_3]NJN56465.1 hypothetical protein [Leptolyngbyaceae cyanobacterium SL_5_9]NJN91043.1 hypothetical protein [Leptolyngbyaceae cyanobacterium SL_5_14]NJO48858.1 hypothetical protein [Leptolyngbyaceae cyanobacterium RM2_2_4]